MTDPSTAAAPPSETPRTRLTIAHVARLCFGLRERVSRRAYLTTGVALMGLKYAIDAGVVYVVSGRFFTPLDYVNPLMFMRMDAVKNAPASEPALVALVVLALPFLWIGVSMTMRRAIDAGTTPWLALMFFVPGVNVLVMLVLAVLPSTQRSSWPLPDPPVDVDARLTSALLGVASGLAIAGVMSALSIYVLGSYGASLFVGTPLAMGAASAYIHNRKRARTIGETLLVAIVAIVMTGMCFLLFALEGVFCLAMAFPIALALGLLGAIVGRAIAVSTSSRRSHAAAALALLPIVCGAEAAWASRSEALVHEVATARIVDAPPAIVWRHVVSFSELPPPTRWFFDAGIAYPLRARIDGEGVGAVRRCEFSTGPFVEPITAWEPPRRLAFDVASQPQPMQEWSPYAFVNAPHLEGSIKSVRGEFRLVPIDGGARTRLEGSTFYVLHIAPAAYWRVWSEVLLHAIHGRVLDHVASLAEHDERVGRP